MIFGIPAILAQQPYPCSDALVTCDDHPGISERAKVFGRIKTESSSVSEAASSLSSSSGSMCLSAIFDQGNAVPTSKRADLFHIAQQAVQMGYDDSVDMLSRTTSRNDLGSMRWVVRWTSTNAGDAPIASKVVVV